MALDPKKYDIRLSGSRTDSLAFRLEHRLLSLGTSDVARLRGYLRVKAWRDYSLRARLHAVRATAKLPARALRDSWRAIGEYGSRATRDFGISRPRQLAHLWWLWVRHGIHAPVYYSFQLYRPGQLRRAPAFFQGYEDDLLFRLVNIRTAREQAELLMDKARFEQWAVEQKLPVARTLLAFEDGEIIRSDLPAGQLPQRDLFSKPNDSSQGRGAQRWVFDGDGWIGEDGGRRREQELIEELTESSRTQDVLLQEQMRNHPALAPLAPAALGTVRVLTLRGLDGVVRPVLAVCKIPVGGAPTDHMRLGGIAAPIDLGTGRLGPAIRKAPETFVAPCYLHPDTGAVIEGYQLPQWESVMRLAMSAHEALDRIVCVGWDVAILENGPILIEGNDNPGHTSSQGPTGIAMGETAVVPTLLARLQASFADPGSVVPRDNELAGPMRAYPRGGSSDLA